MWEGEEQEEGSLYPQEQSSLQHSLCMGGVGSWHQKEAGITLGAGMVWCHPSSTGMYYMLQYWDH